LQKVEEECEKKPEPDSELEEGECLSDEETDEQNAGTSPVFLSLFKEFEIGEDEEDGDDGDEPISFNTDQFEDVRNDVDIFVSFSQRKSLLPELMPQTKFTEFQPLFENLFRRIYLSGLEGQSSWQEVSRVAAEELVQCWLAADMQFPRLYSAVRRMKRKQVGHKKMFKYLKKKLLEFEDRIPSALNINFLVRITLEFMDEFTGETEVLTENKNDNIEDGSEIMESDSDCEICEDIHAEEQKSDHDVISDDENEHDNELIEKLKKIAAGSEKKYEILDENDLTKKIEKLRERLIIEEN